MVKLLTLAFAWVAIALGQDQSPQDCAEVQWRHVKPSEAGVTSSNATDLDSPHYVTATPTQTATDVLRVFLPGTYGAPYQGTKLLQSLASCNRPTIGLSYNYIPLADSQRNDNCSKATGSDDEAHAACLAHYHSDGLWGSQLWVDGPRPWPAVAEQDSVVGRLTLLLAYLDAEFPEEGWGRFRDGDAPRWDRIMVGGHSQGSGHAGYLAQTTHLAGAVLLSGPQDKCQGCAAGPDNLWLAKPWATKHVVAAMQINEDANTTIRENWRRMANLLGWPAEPIDESALIPPPYGAVVSRVPPNPAYTGPRPEHVSMWGDDAIPMESDAVATYSLAFWPALFADPESNMEDPDQEEDRDNDHPVHDRDSVNDESIPEMVVV